MTMTALYQVNIRALLREISQQLHRPATLDVLPDEQLDRWQSLGFQWIWLLSVWQTGDASRQISRHQATWRQEFQAALPDLNDDDIQGSGFAITSYRVHEAIGDNEALQRLRSRLQHRGLRLMLDFVPNHVGLDHPWLETDPDLFVAGTEEQLQSEPQNFFRHASAKVFAYGRDPYFPGWIDTVQLDYSNPRLVARMQEELCQIATLCDGVRCDMAMLVLPDVFQRTWHRPALPFWPEAIQRVKEVRPDFCFMAEVYWDREWELQQLGFDFCYDKRLYDRLLHDTPKSIRLHWLADESYQSRLVRFLENHDEPRIHSLLPNSQHFAAAVLCFLSQGLKFFHEGQLEGWCKKISPHVVRRAAEPVNDEIKDFYTRLLKLLQNDILQRGRWLQLDPKPAWDNNLSFENIIAFRWKDPEFRHLLVIVNYSPAESQARLRLTIDRNCVSHVRFEDRFSNASFEHHRGELFNPGMLVQLKPWQFLVLEETDNS
ncbi:alpha-amylase family glycosyl hydrolase [Pirellulaceae bacterium SH501]